MRHAYSQEGSHLTPRSADTSPSRGFIKLFHSGALSYDACIWQLYACVCGVNSASFSKRISEPCIFSRGVVPFSCNPKTIRLTAV